MPKLLTVPDLVYLKNIITDEDIKTKDPKTEEMINVTISFYMFLISSVLKEQCFGANAMTVMHAIDIKDKVKEAKPGDIVEIEDEAWDLLSKAVKSPAQPFNTEVAIQLGSYFKAILNAESKE